MAFINYAAMTWRAAHLAQTGYKKGFLTRSQYGLELHQLGYDNLTIVEILETGHIPYEN